MYPNDPKDYRSRALRLLPHVCAHCGREFEGKRLRELTVHHRDHDATNNPPDGSNWELLCLYCHDNAHERNKVADALDDDTTRNEPEQEGLHQPFAGLGDLLNGGGTGSNS